VRLHLTHHVPLAIDWATVAAGISAIATVGLLIGAGLTVFYAWRAFTAQSRQLADQLRVNEEQVRVLCLQQRELADSLLVRQRAQAEKVDAEAYYPDAVDFGSTIARDLTRTIIVVVENKSSRPIVGVSVAWSPEGVPYAHSCVELLPGADQRHKLRFDEPIFRFYAPIYDYQTLDIIRAGECFGFAFDIESPEDADPRYTVSFRDDAGRGWLLNQDLHLTLDETPAATEDTRSSGP
jgi:hypothetical protein